jgi:hypothetical protein
MAEDNDIKVRRTREAEDGFVHYMGELRQSSFVLRVLGVALSLGTAIAILWAPSAIAPEKSSYSSDDFLIWAFLVGGNVLLALSFESFRKRGNALFEELSDEFQWHLGSEKKLFDKIGPTRPPIELRVTLRSFLSATDLPLAPGRFGPLIYTIINVILFVLGAVIRWQK